MSKFYDCHGGPGTTQDACGACVTCLHRVIEGLETERDEVKASNQRLKNAGAILFDELDDLTPDENCQCIPHGNLCHSCLFKTSRAALKVWNEAISDSTLNPTVLYVEEVNGGMGPDYAEVYLATGHVIQVNDEGLTVWPSVAAYESGENWQILGAVAFESKEVKP